MARDLGYWNGGRRHSAPFVLKIRFYDPSMNSSNPAKNAAHIHYIGFRQGVDKGFDFEPEKKNHYELDPDSPAAHLEYAHKRPRSHGLFWGEEQVPNPRELQNELMKHEGIVWRMILSLKEVDAIRLGMTTRESWEIAMRASVADAANKMGIPDSNLRWAAAFHDEPGHPHVHLVMWEKVPQRKIGKLSRGEYREVKKEYMREIYADERMRMNAEKSLMRDLALQLTKGTVLDRVDLYREVRKEREYLELLLQAGGMVPQSLSLPKIHDFQADEFAQSMEQLMRMLPEKGRIAYQFMPPNVKEQLNNMSKWVLYRPQFKEFRERYFNVAETMARQYSLKPTDLKVAVEKAEADLCKRMAQIILRGATEMMKNNNYHVDPDKARIVIQLFSQANKRVHDAMPERVITKHAEILKHFGFTQKEQMEILFDWSHKAHLQLDIETINRVVENVFKEERIIDEDPEKAPTPTQLVYILRFSGKEDISETLVRKGISIKDLETELKVADDHIKKAERTVLNHREWKRFTKDFGLEKLSYPWRLVDSAELIAEKSFEAIKRFESAKVRDKDNISWTAFTMTVTLKHMGFNENEQRDFMNKWVAKNEYEGVDINSIINTIQKNEKEKEKDENEGPRYLRKPTWERLMNNLSLEIDYPWITKEELMLEENAFKEAMGQIDSATIEPIADPKERLFVAQTYLKFIKNEPEHNRNYEEVLQKLEEKIGHLPVEQRNNLLLMAEKRIKDIEYFASQYDIKDEQYHVLNDFAKVLFSAGLEKEQVVRFMEDWKDRSGTVVQSEKLDRAIAAAEKYVKGTREWHREMVMSKRNFAELCQKLGVEAPWMWYSDKQFSRMQTSMLGSFIRSIGKIIERETKKHEAQMEVDRRRIMRRSQKEAEREEKERDRENRGR